MKNSHKLTTAGALVLLAATSGHAQSADKFYVNVDGGVAFQSDVAIKGGTGFVGPGGDIKFDTGFRAGAELGYKLNRSFALELETGVIVNSINQVGIQKLSDVSASAQLDEIPLLLNCVYSFPLKGHFKPYIGVGAGMMIGIFDGSKIPGSYFPGQSQSYNDTEYVFAYQAEAGLKYSVSKHIDLGLAYKFVGTTDYSWSANSINLKTDGTMTHSIEATITWRF